LEGKQTPWPAAAWWLRPHEALRPILLEVINERGLSPTAIANELNQREVKTLQPGAHWHA
jgi:hypothetical protein